MFAGHIPSTAKSHNASAWCDRMKLKKKNIHFEFVESVAMNVGHCASEVSLSLSFGVYVMTEWNEKVL